MSEARHTATRETDMSVMDLTDVLTEAKAAIETELVARVAHVAANIPAGQEQVVVARSLGRPPFFEVTTEGI